MQAHEKLDEILKFLESARSLPMSSSVVVNRNELNEQLEELRDILPAELQAAQDVLRKRDTLLYETTSNAERLLEAAAEEGRRLVSEEEVVRAARIEAAEMLQAARDETDRMSRDIDGYVDAKLAHLEVSVNNILEAIRKGREHLSASAGLYGELAADDTGAPRELSEPGEAPRDVADSPNDLPTGVRSAVDRPDPPSPAPAPVSPAAGPQTIELPAVTAEALSAAPEASPSDAPSGESTSPSSRASEVAGHPDGLRRPAAPAGGANGRGWTPAAPELPPVDNQPGEHGAERRDELEPLIPPNRTSTEPADVDINSET